LGERNERGQMLIDFCKRKKLVVTNMWFMQEKRCRYTWKMPRDIGRYLIDYILVRERFRNSVMNSRSYPGADADTDHNLIAARLRLKLKRIVKNKGRKR
jgi:hypothetical protein